MGPDQDEIEEQYTDNKDTHTNPNPPIVICKETHGLCKAISAGSVLPVLPTHGPHCLIYLCAKGRQQLYMHQSAKQDSFQEFLCIGNEE